MLPSLIDDLTSRGNPSFAMVRLGTGPDGRAHTVVYGAVSMILCIFNKGDARV